MTDQPTPTPTPSPRAALDAELDQIAELERVIRAAQAEQFRRVQRARAHAAEVEGLTDASPYAEHEFAARSFVAELATTLVVHEATAGDLVAAASHLTGAFSTTLDALATGAICIRRVRSLLQVATTLPAEVRSEFEAVALERADRQTPSAFRRGIRRLRERLHPESLFERQRRAAEERRVCLEPAEDGMAWLSLHLEAERGVAIMSHLDALADTLDDDGRTRIQRVLDVAADLLLCRGAARADGTAGASGPLGVVRPRVYVTVPVLTLLGHSDEPAELGGYGPIDAATARRLAADAPSFHRILTHPETGAFLSYGRDAYRVPADLAGYLRVRDGGCRFPGCSRRADRCDIDHTTDWAVGGATCHENLAHLCRKHHRLKHHTAWRMSQLPGGDIRWVSPAGREYLSSPENPFRPPPVATAGAHASGGGHADASVLDVGESPPWAARPPGASDRTAHWPSAYPLRVNGVPDTAGEAPGRPE